MSAEVPEHDEQRDRRLGEAIDGYLEQRQQGKPLTIDEWVRGFPDIADELRECLAALALVQAACNWGAPQAAQEAGETAAHGASVPPAAGVVPAPPGYTLLEEIGRGGMGVVYRALQHSTKRFVALKFLATGAYASVADRRRFAREVELAAGLAHPGIVRVLEAGGVGGGLYCAMEFVDGQPLHVYLHEHRLSVSDKLRLFLRIVEAVQYAHSRAVIHRDLKPSNVMVDREGCPRILDFGLARPAPGPAARDPASITLQGQLVGTLPYLSPEQAAGAIDELDTRSDLYSLGVMLYEALTGRLPYDTGGSLVRALHNIGQAIPPRPSRFCPELNHDIDAVLLKALEKSKENRYQTAAQLADDLRCCLRGEPAEANRSSRFYLVRKAYARHRTQVRLAAAGLALVLSASAVILALYVQVQQQRNRLAEQLHLTVLQRGLAHLAAGHDLLAQKLLWAAYLRRPDPHAYWSLLSYYIQNPLLGHCGGSGWITCLAYSPDRRLLANGTLVGTLVVRQPDTLETVWSAQAHGGGLSQVAFRFDSKCLASAGADGRIRLWEADTGQPMAELEGHVGGVTQICFVPGQNRLLSAGNDGQVLLWEPSAARPHLLYVDPSRGPVRTCDLSRDGRQLALAGGGNTVLVLDTQTGRLHAELPRLVQPPEALRFSPDGRDLAVWSQAEVSVWDIATQQLRWKQPAGLSEPRPTSLWDVSPQPHTTWKPSLVFPEDGSVLLAAGWDAVVRAWAAQTGDRLGELRAHGTAVYALAFEPDSYHLAASYVGGISVWDLARHPAMLSRMVHPGLERTCVAVCGSSGKLAWADRDEGGRTTVSVMPVAGTRQVVSWPAHDAPIEALAFDPGGNRLASAAHDGTVTLWDAGTGRPLHSWKVGTLARGLAFSPDGSLLAAGNCDGQLSIWDCREGSLLESWKAHAGLVLALAFSPDGRYLASGGTDWWARFWEHGKQEPVGQRRHREWVNTLAFSPDGRRIATAGADNTIQIGPLQGPIEMQIAAAHAHWVNGVAFLADGRVLVSAGNDGALRFWDAASGQELASLSSRWGPIQSLAATTDQRYLALGAAQAVQLVDLGTAAELIRRETLRSR